VKHTKQFITKKERRPTALKREKREEQGDMGVLNFEHLNKLNFGMASVMAKVSLTDNL
jgi:hypothetical protein